MTEECRASVQVSSRARPLLGGDGARLMNQVRSARARMQRRRESRGFTLIELMVVVVLVALLAALAAPSFSEARNDRIAFDYARQYQQILAQGRARAAGTGSAHLALLTPGTGTGRGIIRLFAALDGTPAPSGPNPVSSCKLNPAQWADTISETAGSQKDQIVGATNTARFIDFAELNRGGVNDDMDLKAQLAFEGTATTALAVCITPAGVTYVGSGGNATAAINAMRASTPFTGLAEVHVQRHKAGAGIGLERIVQISGGAAPRLRSK